MKCRYTNGPGCPNCCPSTERIVPAKPLCAHQWFKVRTIYRKATPLDATCVMYGENMREGILLQCANDGCEVTKELYG